MYILVIIFDKEPIVHTLTLKHSTLNHWPDIMTNFKGTKQEVLALGTFVKLIRASESVSSDVHRPLADTKLSVSQFGILEALYHLGPMCQKDIAQKILKSAGNITMVLDNLEKQGLVVRERSSQDRRYYEVKLTDKGNELIARIFPDHAEKIRERMSLLSAEELKTLSRLLRKLKQP